MKKVSILGSTGSIGTQSLDVIANHKERFTVSALTAGKNTTLLSQQIQCFSPELAVVATAEDAAMLQKKHPHTEILYGEEGLIAAAAKTDCQIVINALMGMRGLVPTYEAIKAGKEIALANKETLVAGGEVIMQAAKQQGITILPIDSEHSAIFQALQGNEKNHVRRILLTASGGPFRGYSLEKLQQVTLEQALQHPNWQMGSKITIDSATMMNKGLEVIEARWLFDVPAEKIEVVVHPQSIIHSMVEYEDHSIIAQLGLPDMRMPISYALSYPARLENTLPAADFFEIAALTFEKPDIQTFRCLDLAFAALKTGGSCPVVLNAANEILVQAFLEKRIKFIDIQNTIEKILFEHTPVFQLNLENILEIDQKIRRRTAEIVEGGR